MIEGWCKDQYLILFEESEIFAATLRYNLENYLPQHEVVGIIGWDDLIVRDTSDELFVVPSVPLTIEKMRVFDLALKADSLMPDERFESKIKWYVKPIVFGGDPSVDENMTWVDHKQHGELVSWWNDLYRSKNGSVDDV